MDNLKLGGFFTVFCFDETGNLIWFDAAKNIVVNEGLSHMLDVVFNLDSVVAVPLYIGITTTSPVPLSTDTMLVHDGWVEFTDYSEGVRQLYTPARTGLVADNILTKGEFSITVDGDVGGAFIATESTGSTGKLISVSAFNNGDKEVLNGNILTVQYDFTAYSM